MDIKSESKKIEKEIINWRRELHKIPEIHTNLEKTTAYVKNALEDMQLNYETYSNMGIRVVLDSGKNGKILGIRADMDALPIVEETGLEYSAKGEYMHACGHDAHVAMILGVLKILVTNKNSWNGKVVVLFQPAEETTGGAKDMIEEGCLKNPSPERFINFHLGTIFPSVKNGQIGVKKGPIMAAVDSYEITVKGVGGHGARPHECVDPIVIAAEIIQSMQKIVSRELNPVHGAVITVGMINGGTIVNVIPNEVKFSGTIRTLDPADRDYVGKRMEELSTNIAKANRAEVEFTLKKYYPATVNNSESTDFLAKAAAKILGEENVVEIMEPCTGTEDIAYYLEKVPGTFGALGSWKTHSDGVLYPHHNSKFDLDESVMYLGVAVYVQCVVDFC